jgi:DegV family protein with EDD domain
MFRASSVSLQSINLEDAGQIAPFSFVRGKQNKGEKRMQRNVGIVVDSTFGLDLKEAKKHGITVVPLKVIIDQDEYVDGTLDPEIVVKALGERRKVKTSQPSPEQFVEAIKEQQKTYEEVLVLTISSTLSGTFNSAKLAHSMIGGDKVAIIDSETTITGGHYLTFRMIDYFDQGHSLSEGLVYLEELKSKGYLLFTVNNLQTLADNGRLGRVQAFIGNVMKVKPILRFKQGVLELDHKVRSMNNVYLHLIKEIKKFLEKGKVVVRIGYVDRKTEAHQLIEMVKELGDRVSVKLLGVISPVISAHVGLGGLGIYLANEEA